MRGQALGGLNRCAAAAPGQWYVVPIKLESASWVFRGASMYGGPSPTHSTRPRWRRLQAITSSLKNAFVIVNDEIAVITKPEGDAPRPLCAPTSCRSEQPRLHRPGVRPAGGL